MAHDIGYFNALEGDVLAEWRKRSQNKLYQTDPEAWMWDVLGQRWWSKQQEIAQSFVVNEYTLVKSCNGVGKTKTAADLVTWFASVHPPEETSILLSAPVREQIDTMMFKYLKENYYQAQKLKRPLIGEITRWPKWVVHTPFEKDIVLPKRPADANLVSSFQGVHDTHVAVVLDEAGGLPEDLYIGADAVTTNDHARILGIGNPDRLNTGFHARFTQEKHDNWNRITIGANDSPNFTKEVIYPDDPDRDAAVKRNLVQVKWAKKMRRSAPPGIIAAKVDGEFPKEDDTTFFTQDVVNRAHETMIEPKDRDEKWIGADLSSEGTDQSVMYLNHGGKIRKADEWNRDTGTATIQSARRIHNLAMSIGATQVRVDKAGTGFGVWSNLCTLDEFADREYILVGILGAGRARDSARFPQARSWHYQQFLDGMVNREIDLDIEDLELRDELIRQPYVINNRGQMQIMPKADMKKHGIDSPDHLDAAIYSMVDVSDLITGPAAGLEAGDTLLMDPWEMLQVQRAGLPV